MSKLYIFAILFLAEETKIAVPCFLMLFSDAQPVQFWQIECDTYNQHVHDGVFHRCFCQPWNCDDPIVIQAVDTDSSPAQEKDISLIIRDENDSFLQEIPFEVDLTHSDEDTIIYNLSFIPSELSPSLCDQKVRFLVYDNDLEDFIAHSDCHQITSSTPNTILAEYYNHLNVFGLYYQDFEPKFYLRIPAIFFHQRFPEEEEVIELTSELVTVNGSMRRQRLLDTDYLPYYFHEKIKLMLKHQYVKIFNKLWAKQDSYEIQDGNRMYPEKKAKCWLSEKEYLQRNVL